MNRPELYKKTVDILYQAYFDDTLEHSICTACAVGNLVAANNNYKVIKSSNVWEDQFGRKVGTAWQFVFYTGGGIQYSSPSSYFGYIKQQIDSTGYPVEQLSKIEYAFETADRGSSREDRMFNGLVAVLDVLAQIHDVTDADLLSSNSKRFSDHYKTLSPCPATNAII